MIRILLNIIRAFAKLHKAKVRASEAADFGVSTNNESELFLALYVYNNCLARQEPIFIGSVNILILFIDSEQLS
ncbi:hypothetical protein P40081_24490 [Paenibacillus sp. FSL P4-0081]|nr:hypothetical protein P40081_24490 [Paenibacillus sp. FSL P4-0081]